jgi:ubiquinol-cytochrome c reductase cytochrome b subunit
MWRRVWRWINDRWPADATLRALLTEEIPGGATIKYSFGASVLFVFILQAATGIWQLFFYVPTADHAYNSVSYLRTEVPFGWLIHNLHYWGATVMIVLLLLHVMRVYIWGAYKSPRELTWLLGTFLFLLTMSMMFFGPPLPWDEKGYWATEVGTSIAGTVPLVGSWLKRVLIGGDTMGQLTVSRLFALHVAVLPGLLATFIGLHLVSFRRFGSVGPWQEDKRVRRGIFWPDQVYKDLIMAGAVFLILIALSVFAQPSFTGPADPLDKTYTPKPEWNFLFLYQALRLFPGKLEVLGTMGIPLVGILLLLCVPFVDRRAERNPARRPVAMGALFTAGVIIIVLSLIGSASHPGVNLAGRPAGNVPPAASRSGASPSSAAGAALFQSLGCTACHTVEGKGGKIGPDLSDEGSRNRVKEWLTEQIRDPKSHNPNSVMPSFKSLKENEVLSLVEYLLSLKTAGVAPASAEAPSKAMPTQPTIEPTTGTGVVLPAQLYIGSTGHGNLLFSANCLLCHGPEGTDKVPNPGSDDSTVPLLNPIDRELFDKDPAVFVSKIDPFLQNGSTPSGTHPALKMPDFGKSMALTQEQISNLEAYVLHLNGVDRAQISHPGLRPVFFFILTIAVFAAAVLAFVGILLTRKRRPRRPPLP